MNRTYLEYTSCIFFWKYLKEEKSYERDLKIYFAYQGLGISASILLVILMGIGITLVNTWNTINGNNLNEYPLDTIFAISFLLSFGNYFFQYFAGRVIYLKIRNARWDARMDEFEDWIKEFFWVSNNESDQEFHNEEENKGNHSNEEFHNDGENQENHRNERFKKQYKEYFEEKLNSGNSEEEVINTILNKFELPLYTNDVNLIKKRYRTLVKKFHPDMPDGNAEIFKQVKSDYETLKFYFNQKKTS
ncbi:J domain-containing protein [Halobacillus halophilus]|uniref:J domain-containing protein n=1 Tax=Halobacillus halophilus (strain ATCC 35676 / DSM 2266 / JCM 20832 / KCTC 3685 / LMG 17431 / NBRC 102448 / NCIMB 2269) TaxID=866895 RepID=I0JRI5_HALH3|nr:J domain-containing protein [Halobacillus halophilus]ASF40727.1 J domain-containing protein [Halobacillus halophilus]CCG46756.1 hypothetical protein HBHAL_4416 [Halobacillus halophilus DSM 2266]